MSGHTPHIYFRMRCQKLNYGYLDTVHDGPFFRSPVTLWTNPSTSGACMSFIFAQILHEFCSLVRELFQDACPHGLRSHANCLHYSMEVDLCIKLFQKFISLPPHLSDQGCVGWEPTISVKPCISTGSQEAAGLSWKGGEREEGNIMSRRRSLELK